MFTIEAINSKGEKTTRSFKHFESAEKAFSLGVFMSYGTDMKIYFYDENNNLIDSWDLPKGARRMGG
jgi:hypothetical protein